MITSFMDFLPEGLYHAHEELVRNLLPQAWWSNMLPREIINWSHLFSYGGVAVYDQSLAFECGKGANRGESVGTFMVKGSNSYFVGSDEDGVWCHTLDKDSRWKAPRELALFLRTCSGPVDARADVWHARLAALDDTLSKHATANTAFRALLSLGRLYIPNVKESLQAPYCQTEQTELY